MPWTRQQILAAALLRPDKSWYLRELAEFLEVQPSSLQRELANLTESGILVKTIDGNRTYFKADPSCPIFPDLQQLLTKTVGVVDLLSESLLPFSKKIDVAFVYGSVAAGTAGSQSDVDLFVIGDIGLADLATVIRTAEQRLGREINPVILSPGEARKKLKEKDHFVRTVRRAKKLFLIGEEHELATAFS